MNDESEFIGRPLDEAPTRDPTEQDCMGKKKQKREGEVVRDDDGNALFGGYCRSWPGKGTDHVGRGRCKHHAGSTPTGEDHPGFKHGLFSDHLDEQDRETIEALEEYDDAEKLDELINWRLARLRRAVQAMQDDEDQRTFWDAFDELVRSTDDPEPEQIQELARMLSQGNRAMQDEIDLVRKLIKDHNKIDEGEDINLTWRQMLAGDDE